MMSNTSGELGKRCKGRRWTEESEEAKKRSFGTGHFFPIAEADFEGRRDSYIDF